MKFCIIFCILVSQNKMPLIAITLYVFQFLSPSFHHTGAVVTVVYFVFDYIAETQLSEYVKGLYLKAETK